MILFKEDFYKYGAVPQFNTKNQSALHMAALYKKMGLNNWYWPLALVNKELENIDPWSNNLTDHEMALILYESKINCMYFFREVLRIPTQGGEPIPYQFNRGNLAAIWTFFNDIDMGWVMPRQTGKTYGTQGIIWYIMGILADNLNIGMYTKDNTLLQDNVARLKELRDSGTPEWMVQRSTKDWDRKEGVSYALKGNYYKTFTTANDEQSANKLGRGSSMAIVHFDEIAFMKYNWVIVPNALATMLAASKAARERGIPAPVIYTTTAGNPDTRMGRYALDIFSKAMPFTEALYDLKNREELVKVITASADTPMLYLEFSYRQLGRTDEWFKQVTSRTVISQDDINRDYLNIWQASTDKDLISPELAAKIRGSRREPCFTDLSDGFAVRWYQPKNIVESDAYKQRPLVMGMDTSENIGRDYTTFVIIDPKDMAVQAVSRCNESNVMQVARHVVTLLLKFPKLVWVPERNHTGSALIDFALEELCKKDINPWFRIYNEVVQQYGDPKFKDISLYNYHDLYGQVRKHFGFFTNATTRDLLYKQTMMKNLEMNATRIYDSTLISEYCNLTVRNGRIDHREGLHDDSVISNLLAAYFVFFGTNLHMYGIDEHLVLTSVDSQGNAVSQKVREEQLAIRRRIAELESKLAEDPPYILRNTYERELTQLRIRVDDKVVAVKPIAVSQVKYQEKQMTSSGDQNRKLDSFLNKYISAWNRVM